MAASLFLPRTKEPDPDWLAEMRSRQMAAKELASRIGRAVEDAGLDPRMLDDLPATYVAAALALGVK